MLDPDRPCDSKNRKKNRYTKEELLKLASELKNAPSDLKKLTIDALCELLRGQTKQPTKKTTVSRSSCSLDESRPCDSKSRKPTRYKKEELVSIWNSSCSNLSNEKPKTIDQYCNAIKKLKTIETVQQRKTPPIQEHKIKSQPVSQLAQVSRNKISRFLKKAVVLKKKHGLPYSFHKMLDMKMFPAYIPIPHRPPKTVGKNLLTLLSKIERNKLRPNDETTLHIDFHCNEPKLRLKNDPDADTKDPMALFNRNLTVSDFKSNQHWIEKQTEYIQNLGWVQKLVLLGYTYGGDKMVNQKLLKFRIDPESIIPTATKDSTDSPYSRYLHCCVFPLAVFLYLDVKKSKTPEDLVRSYQRFSKTFDTPLRKIWNKIHSKSFTHSYGDILVFFQVHRSIIPSAILSDYIDRFEKELKDIIRNAPKTEVQFWVYRGIQGKAFVRVGSSKRYVFHNELFMSTSLSLCKSAFFKDRDTPCCIQQILVPKGCSCIFISLLSAFPTEKELLFAPGAYMYPLTDDFMASNTRVETRKFLIAN